MSCFNSFGVNLCTYSYTTCNISCLRLCPAHSPQPRGYEKCSFWGYINFSKRIKNCDGGAVNNSLRTYVHVTSSGHLSILGNPQSIVFLPIVGTGVIWDHHPVG